MAIQTLYHFTSLFHFPSIVNEGLTRGEVPTTMHEMQHGTRLSYPNFTASAGHSIQHWSAGTTDKTKIRITVDFDSDEKLKPFEPMVKDAAVLRALDPKGQAKFWYIYFGVVPPERFKLIEIKEKGKYRELAGEELAELLKKISEEKNAKFVRKGKNAQGYDTWSMKPGVEDSWLSDGVDAAEWRRKMQEAASGKKSEWDRLKEERERKKAAKKKTKR